VAVVEALVCVEPGKLELQERGAPRGGADLALVRPRRIGICGTDYHILQGRHPYLQYPRVMGHELAVEVVDAPTGSGLSSGDLCVVNPYLSCGRCIACRKEKPNCCANISVLGVHQDGGMAELLALPPGNLIPARGLTADQCAAVEFLAIGAHAVRRGGVSTRDRVLVVGAGPIGLGVAIAGSGVAAMATAIQLAKADVEVDVFEAKPELSALGSGITIQGNALRVFDTLGVWERVRDAGYAFEGLTLRAPGPGASVIADLPEVKTGGPDYPAAMGMYRPDLARILVEGGGGGAAAARGGGGGRHPGGRGGGVGAAAGGGGPRGPPGARPTPPPPTPTRPPPPPAPGG
jgi:hypothetical protein